MKSWVRLVTDSMHLVGVLRVAITVQHWSVFESAYESGFRQYIRRWSAILCKAEVSLSCLPSDWVFIAA